MITLEKIEDDKEVGFVHYRLVSDDGPLPEPYEHPSLLIDPLTLEHLNEF